MARQLTLPALRGMPRPDRTWRARRDLTLAQFARALVRNRFKPADDNGGLHFIDLEPDGFAGRLEAVYLRDPVRVHRRKTLAKLLQARDEVRGR